MNLFEMADNLGSKMRWYDFSILKLSMVFATLFLLTAWEAFRNLTLGVDWYWYLIATLVLIIPLMKKMFSD